MISIYIIISVLGTTALTKGSIECNFTESTEPRECFGAAGDTLIFHLPKRATVLELKKDDKYRVLQRDRHGIVTLYDENGNKSEHTNNVTLKLGNANKRHSGEYVLEEYRLNGQLLRKVNVHLEIQAPVSKPAVSQTCLTLEQMKVVCSTEGDDVKFIFILDGQLLIQNREHNQSLSKWTAGDTSVSNVPINLHGQLTGNLMCRVWNNVSRDEAVIQLAACEAVPVVIVAAVASVVAIFLLVALSLVILKIHKKKGIVTVNEETSEVIYADVRVIKNSRTSRPSSHQQ
ncbi:uncharacterized protein [Embiotoca jacksoni]|uniref:uncharacterized protein n=1 Tax=Embiotoca jacksoni TaxID=100190 RepID=UPI00370376FB